MSREKSKVHVTAEVQKNSGSTGSWGDGSLLPKEPGAEKAASENYDLENAFESP